jgi:hypothetical protein
MGGGAGALKFLPVAEVEREVWRRVNAPKDTECLACYRVLLVGFASADLAVLREHLRALGVRASGAAPSVKQLHDVAGLRGLFTHAVLNFDAYEDVSAGVDALRGFRSNCREIVLVALSSEVRADDVSAERSTICDATLRLPVSLDRLRNGLVQGAKNNCKLSEALCLGGHG